MEKLYCYVDETGQDTKGKLFLVSIILQDLNTVNDLKSALSFIEKQSGKKLTKWNKAKHNTRVSYLKLLFKCGLLHKNIFFSKYNNSVEYFPLLSLTIAKSILSKNLQDYSARIIIDGLKVAEASLVRSELKSLKIKFTKVRGMKDEQDEILRLADSIAGFTRDYLEGKPYAQILYKRFIKFGIITQI